MKKKRYIKKSIKRNITYIFLFCIVHVARLLPRRVAISVMRPLASVYYVLSPRLRRNTLNHLRRAFKNEKSEAEIKHIARNVFRHFATVAVDAARIPLFVKHGINQYVTTSNFHHFETAMKSGKGAIGLTCHFGNWELLGTWLAQKGYPLHVVGARAKDPKIDEIVVSTRNKAGYTNIARGKGTREIINALRKGYPLGMLIDQATKVKGVFVDFFGMPTHTATAPAYLARKFDIPIIPLFLRLKDDLTYHLECFEPLNLIDTGDVEKDILANTQLCSDAYEKIIRLYPQQWVWMHRRWKIQPEEDMLPITKGQ